MLKSNWIRNKPTYSRRRYRLKEMCIRNKHYDRVAQVKVEVKIRIKDHQRKWQYQNALWIWIWRHLSHNSIFHLLRSPETGTWAWRRRRYLIRSWIRWYLWIGINISIRRRADWPQKTNIPKMSPLRSKCDRTCHMVGHNHRSNQMWNVGVSIFSTKIHLSGRIHHSSGESFKIDKGNIKIQSSMKNICSQNQGANHRNLRLHLCRISGAQKYKNGNGHFIILKWKQTYNNIRAPTWIRRTRLIWFNKRFRYWKDWKVSKRIFKKIKMWTMSLRANRSGGRTEDRSVSIWKGVREIYERLLLN